jgi:hypothetical protein
MSIAESFGRSGFAQFVNSPAGRVVRIVAGLGLVAWGCSNRGGASGTILLILGLVPLAAGAFDWCLISALLGGPLSGRRIRERTGSAP